MPDINMISLALWQGLLNAVGMKQAPLVSRYSNAYQYLQDYYFYRKCQDESFSYEVWARELKFKNRSYLRLVVLGHRPVSEAAVPLFIEQMKLEKEAARYFSVLVAYTQSKSLEQRQLFGKKLIGLARRENQDRIDIQEHYEFLSNPLLPKLQTLMSFEDSPSSAVEVAEALGVESSEAQKALKTLERLQLLRQNENGRWVPKKRSWKVAEGFHQLGPREFYKNVFSEAQAAIELLPAMRRFRSLFVAMNAHEFQDFLQDFESFVEEQLAKRDVESLQDRTIYNLNFNFFPVSKS